MQDIMLCGADAATTAAAATVAIAMIHALTNSNCLTHLLSLQLILICGPLGPHISNYINQNMIRAALIVVKVFAGPAWLVHWPSTCVSEDRVRCVALLTQLGFAPERGSPSSCASVDPVRCAALLAQLGFAPAGHSVETKAVGCGRVPGCRRRRLLTTAAAIHYCILPPYITT